MKSLHRSCLVATLALGTAAVARPLSLPLFNGRDLAGWHIDVPAMDKDPALASPFVVREGKRVSLGQPKGHIITDADHADYRLTVEYRFAGKPGNCGVLVNS